VSQGLAALFNRDLLELLHELVPKAAVIGALVNPTSPNAETVSKDLQAAARALGLEIHIMSASTEHDIDTAFATCGWICCCCCIRARVPGRCLID
jgi:ABC-type uncharacterized transport system substrate-binding protein